MCACTDTYGFKDKLKQAKLLTATTGQVHVVFSKQIVNQVFVCKESDLSDALDICCYFLPSGVEVVYVKKNVNQIVVNKPKTVVAKKKRVTKKSKC